MKRKYNHQIEIVNESSDEKLFEANKAPMLEMITDLLENNFDFDINLKVLVRDLETKKYYVNDETDCGFSTMEKKTGKFVVCFSTESLRRVEYDRGVDIGIAIHHELGHIYDLYQTMNNKYYKINPLLAKHKIMTDFVVAGGWSFWTEFFAYYFTFKTYYDWHNYPTFLQLVKGYEKLQNDYAKLQPRIEVKNKETIDMAEQFIDDVKVFTYSVAKHLAGYVAGKPKSYKYTDKTKQRPAFKKVDRLCQGLLNRAAEMFSNTYGKGMARKLGNIGDYIIRKVYMDFDIIPVKHKGHIAYAFFSKD